jgi:ABC-2 type transport system ATP-binding protein
LIPFTFVVIILTVSSEFQTIIQVEHLHKAYGSVIAVDDVSFSVRQGEIFGILGRNGAGKTTTIECLEGLRHADAGTMRVLGLSPTHQSGLLRRRIGCQLQESALPDKIKVSEALQLFAALSPVPSDWRQLIADWGLNEKSDTVFHNLSGGQRQRLLVALALVNNPEVVFLDEMTTGLDPAGRRVAWDLIRTIRDRGATVILVTHFMDEAESLCDRVAIIDHGKVIALDTPQSLINTYSNEIRVVFSTFEQELGWLRSAGDVHDIKRSGPRVVVSGHGALLALVAAALVNHGIIPEDLHVEEPTLEDVFLNLTGYAGGLE